MDLSGSERQVAGFVPGEFSKFTVIKNNQGYLSFQIFIYCEYL